MADVVAEPHSASGETEVKQNEAANGNSDKSIKTNNGAAEEKLDEVRESNGAKKVGEEGAHKGGSSSRDDRKRRDHDDRNSRGRGRGRGRGSRGGGRGRGGFQRKDNVRTRFERKEESSDATEIRRQVDFYFSDSNLPIDKFLLEETRGPENKPFPLKTIHNFKRMRHFQPFSAIVEAVKTSDFLEVNDQDEVYRKVPLEKKFTLDVKKNSELLTSDSLLRSVYAKGFGAEQDSTAFDIEEFFQPYGILSVRLRRQADGVFKGSVFVEFENEEAAHQFLDMEEKPKFDEKELLIMSKKDYVDMKSQDILEGKVIPKSPRHQTSYDNNRRGRGGSSNGGYKRKDRDDDDADNDNWRERRERFQQTRGRGGGRGGKRGRNDHKSRSRSRSPFRNETERTAALEGIDAAEPVESAESAMKVDTVSPPLPTSQAAASATELEGNEDSAAKPKKLESPSAMPEATDAGTEEVAT